MNQTMHHFVRRAHWIHIDWVHHTNTKPVKMSNDQTTNNLIENISGYSEEANNASFCQESTVDTY